MRIVGRELEFVFFEICVLGGGFFIYGFVFSRLV